MATVRNNRPHLGLLALEDRTVPAAVAGVMDFGFEASPVASFKYNPAGSPWAFTGSAGLTANATDFTRGNPAAPQGGQVAFVQNNGSVSQTMTLAAGTYVLNFSAAQRGNQTSAQTFNVLVDGKVVGSFNSVTGTNYSTQTTSTFTVAAGTHTVAFQGTNLYGGDNTVFIDNVQAIQQSTNLGDGGFEQPVVGDKGFKYAPSGSPWTFAGPTGLSANNTDFTNGNPAAPQASQVAFIQGKGGISQKVNFAAGTYALTFAAAQRGNWGTPQTLQVLVDGKVVGTFNTIASAGYTTLTTSSFAVTAGQHTITFQGTNLYGGDSTLFIDQVAIAKQTAGLGDSGFEASVLPGNGFDYNPTGTSWAFTGPTGLAANGSDFTSGNPVSPQGEQVAFIQGTGSISQAVTFAAGTYTLSFNAAQRGNWGNAQTIQVLVDGNVVGEFKNLAGATYATLTTNEFTVTAGSHTVTFEGTNLNGGDSTLFIDQVTLAQVATSLGDGGFEAYPLGEGGFRYGPAGSAWAFAGEAGVAGNGSRFTSGNDKAPQGTLVAFLQGTGAMSQGMTFAAGTYTLTFAAAQRGNVASGQTFNVLVDGAVVGTFNNLSGTAYTPLATSSFTVDAGVHTVSFQGTNLRGGDNTVFIDAVVVNPQLTGLTDTGFESPALAADAFQYDPKGTPWAFNGSAGVASNGSGFTAGNPIAPQGSQVAFLQGKGSVSQTVSLPAGSYQMIFRAAQRGNVSSSQILQVSVDGTIVGTFDALKGPSYATLETYGFIVSPGNHIVTFQGMNESGDNTMFIDQVTVIPA